MQMFKEAKVLKIIQNECSKLMSEYGDWTWRSLVQA